MGPTGANATAPSNALALSTSDGGSQATTLTAARDSEVDLFARFAHTHAELVARMMSNDDDGDDAKCMIYLRGSGGTTSMRLTRVAAWPRRARQRRRRIKNQLSASREIGTRGDSTRILVKTSTTTKTARARLIGMHPKTRWRLRKLSICRQRTPSWRAWRTRSLSSGSSSSNAWDETPWATPRWRLRRNSVSLSKSPRAP